MVERPILFAKSHKEVLAHLDRVAGVVKLRLRYRAEGRTGFWPGEEYRDWSEAWEQQDRMSRAYPGVEFTIEEG